MNATDYEKAVDTLSALTNALGAGLATWGVINLLEAYDDAAAKEEIAAAYRSRIAEVDLILQRLFEDKATGRITTERYQALCAEHDAEMHGLLEALHGLDAKIEARKEQGVKQIIHGAGLAAIAPTIRACPI